MSNLIITLIDLHIPELLLVSSLVLILLDYFLPIDFLAFLGYISFAAGMFFYVPFNILYSLLFSLAIALVLFMLHAIWWGKYLSNIHSYKVVLEDIEN